MSQPTRHPVNALTATFVRNTKKPGRYADGGGLYLVVDPSGARRWVLRMMVAGRRRDMGLGSVRFISLKEAREKTVLFRKTIRDGGDPVQLREREVRVVPTFKQAAEQVHSERSDSYKNKKHAAQWIQTLNTYAFKYFGDLLIDQIQTTNVLRALQPIWLSKPETARRVKQRIQVVFDWAKAHGFYTGDNPVANVKSILPRQAKTTKHFDAMPYVEVPLFVSKLQQTTISERTRLGIELIILTALRTNEVRLGTWPEIDWKRKIWTIPASRQLKKRQPTPHIVPLPPRCIQILKRLKGLSKGSQFIFPGSKPTQAFSDMTLLMALRRLEIPFTIHGFRSSFRDWASEETNHRHEVIEESMAHEISNQVEAAYRRGDLLNKRRVLMTDWANYVATPRKHTAL